MPKFPDPNSNRNNDPANNDAGSNDSNENGGGNNGGDNGNPSPQNGGPKQQPPGNFLNRNSMTLVLLLGLAALMFVVMGLSNTAAEEKPWQEFVQIAKDGQFDGAVTVKNFEIVGTLIEGHTVDVSERVKSISTKISPETKNLRVYELESEIGQAVTEDAGSNLWAQMLITWLPFIIIALLIYFFIFRGLRNAGGGPGGMLGNFGRSKHKMMNKETSKVRLNDVAGITEAKEEVGEIIEFLKNGKKFQRLGGRVPRGVLLVGPPGCGKTLLAKAVAGEAEVPFFSISGSDFVEMFVGVGASRVRDLFKQAKDSSPCIIFLDEIDAVGRKRGNGVSGGGGNDEREQTLNAILVEMDGFDSSDQVIVVAATNRADVLDPALTRPGRFDRSIDVVLPDIKGRMEILKVHSKKVKLSPDVNLERIARGTPMFSGAELEAVINEAAIIATLANKDFIEMEDLEEARDKVRFGRARKSHKIEEDERVATAYHEAGHAVAQYLLPNADPLHKVTIIPRGQAMGATFSLPEKDRHGYGAKYLTETMRVLCAGRIAEQRKTDDVTSGAAMDIRMATAYARHMILEWGMSERLGFIDYATSDNAQSFAPDRNYSEKTAQIIDEEVKLMTDEAYNDCVKLLDDNWDKVVAISEALLKYETLTFEEVDRIMKGETLDKKTVSELLEEEQEKAEAPAPENTTPPVADTDTDDEAPGMMPSPA